MSGGAAMHRGPGSPGDTVVEAEFEEVVRADDPDDAPEKDDAPRRRPGGGRKDQGAGGLSRHSNPTLPCTIGARRLNRGALLGYDAEVIAGPR